jgi:hypothetical protein
MSRHGNFATAIITTGTALSAAINLDTAAGVPENMQSISQRVGMRLGGIIMPPAWTAASLSFQISADGVTFADLRDRFDTEITATVTANNAYLFDLVDWVTFPWLRIRSGTAVTPVNQVASRTLTLLLRATGV